MDTLMRAMAGSVLLAALGSAQANPNPPAERCEAAVTQTIERLRGREARDIEFTAARRAVSPPSGDEVGVRGEGRYRKAGAAVPFSYSCAYNTKTGETSGVVFRESDAAAAASAAPAAWQPDLSRISPEACESAVVAVLKDRHPRVEGIVFGSESRRLDPVPNSRLGLAGQGALRRAPGMHAVPFSYRCEFDSRSGQVLKAEAQP